MTSKQFFVAVRKGGEARVALVSVVMELFPAAAGIS